MNAIPNIQVMSYSLFRYDIPWISHTDSWIQYDLVLESHTSHSTSSPSFTHAYTHWHCSWVRFFQVFGSKTCWLLSFKLKACWLPWLITISSRIAAGFLKNRNPFLRVEPSSTESRLFRTILSKLWLGLWLIICE